MTALTVRYRAYKGITCPHCDREIELASLRNGTEICPYCSIDFEATLFTPPNRSLRVAQVIESGPDGANACAMHARNAAIGNCDRCGVFICSLCAIDIDADRYCPPCFERLSAAGELASARVRTRDVARLAAMMSILGLLSSPIFGLPLGLAGVYYGVRSIRDRKRLQASPVLISISLAIAVADIGIGFYFFLATLEKW